MQYMKVLWNHDFDDEPIVIYSELDSDRYEVRKIEVYRNGKAGYASPTTEHNGTRLSVEVPLPEQEEIAADPQFEPTLISKADFEEAWAAYVPD